MSENITFTKTSSRVGRSNYQPLWRGHPAMKQGGQMLSGYGAEQVAP